MSFSYLNEDNLFDKYDASKTYTEALTEPFPEFERIARNRPYDGINKKYPKVTDGTTSAIIRKTARRVLQQVPTGSIVADSDDAWLPVVADNVYRNEIIPNANEDYDLVQKCWTVIEKGLTFGVSPTYSPFVSHDGGFYPDLTVPFWGDIYLQPGKKSGYACKYLFMRSWFQKEDLEDIQKQQKSLAKSAKARGEKYESLWDNEALTKILNAVDGKNDKNKPAHEKDRKSNDTGIELVTAFQTGVGSIFYTFNPLTKTVVRRKKNKDPRGKMPIDFFYSETDGSNPLGRGIVELIGGLQNMIDSDMQMYNWNRALMIDPPMKKIGNFNRSTVRYEPGYVNDLGSDPRNDLVVMTVDTTAVAQYPSLYGLQKSQLLNLVSSPDTSISAEVGNPGFSKTPAGINQQKANISIDDNYIRKMFEAWFQNWSETAINLYFAERSGVELIQLNNDAANKLRKLAEEGKFDINKLNDKDQIMVDFDVDTPALKFRVDASTSKLQDDQTQQNALGALIQAIDTSPALMQMMSEKYPDKILALWNKIVDVSGVEDPEELSIDLNAFAAEMEQQKAMQEAQAQMQARAQAQAQAPEQILSDQPQPQPGGVHDQFTQVLRQMGFDDGTIQNAHQMADNGYSDQEIMQQLGVASGR